MTFWRKIYFFGDSLTQYSFSPNGWGAAVADAFQRKADVVNRGFSGYNTKNALDLLNVEFPAGSIKDQDTVVVCFGANDSVLEGCDQHVSLERFSQNMGAIINHFISLGVPQRQIVVMSPSPVDADAWILHKIAEKRGDDRDHINSNAELYAEAAEKVATANSCAFINLWSAFMNEPNWKGMFCDGLHFNDNGNQFVANLLLGKLGNLSEDWKMYHPEWRDFYESSG